MQNKAHKMLKICAWLSTLLVTSYAAGLPEFIQGTPITTPEPDELYCNAPSILECHSCKHIRICDSKSKIAAIRRCADATPFCNNKKCSPTPDRNLCKSDALCPKPNKYFQNPTNCKEYHYCDSMKMAIRYQCPPKYVYDQKTSNCKLATFNRTCSEIDCKLPTNQEQLIPYPGENSIYTYCDVTDGRTIIFACDEGEHFEVETLSCEFACQAEGHFVYKHNCRKYNACYSNSNNTFTKVLTDCPPGMIFNSEKKVCDLNLKECPPKPSKKRIISNTSKKNIPAISEAPIKKRRVIRSKSRLNTDPISAQKIIPQKKAKIIYSPVTGIFTIEPNQK